MVSHLPPNPIPMEKSVTGGGDSANQRSYDWKGSLTPGMKNPFSLKVGQVFTGFGVGCGVGIGVGRPIYLGSIPALQQVLTATRGATDVFSGAGRQINSYMRRFGVKGVEAGIGCGVGIGHGFGVGLALKPGVVQQVQSCVGQAMEKMMTNLGFIPGLSAVRSVVPRFVHSSTHAGNGSSVGDIKTTFGDFTHLASGSAFSDPTRNGSSTTESTHESLGWKTSSETSIASHSEKVINSFLQNPVLKNEEETKLNELAGSLRSENNVLQMVLKHQQVIEELVEQNEKLRGILVDELKVSPSKLETRTRSWTKLNNPCSDCFECRRKRTTR